LVALSNCARAQPAAATKRDDHRGAEAQRKRESEEYSAGSIVASVIDAGSRVIPADDE